MRYILFDIDGTLTAGGSGGGAGAKALNSAFHEMHAIEHGFDNVQKAGKTDPIILNEGFAQHGVPVTAQGGMAFMKRYLDYLEEFLTQDELRSTPIDGAQELLEELAGREDTFLGLLTGNWKSGARLKLESVDLHKYFDGLGAFGEDAATRPELVPVAWKRFYARTRSQARPDDTIIIGDTPRDVECAHANNVRAIAVLTGPFSREELEAAGAELIVPSLAAKDEILRFIYEGS